MFTKSPKPARSTIFPIFLGSSFFEENMGSVRWWEDGKGRIGKNEKEIKREMGVLVYARSLKGLPRRPACRQTGARYR